MTNIEYLQSVLKIESLETWTKEEKDEINNLSSFQDPSPKDIQVFILDTYTHLITWVDPIHLCEPLSTDLRNILETQTPYYEDSSIKVYTEDIGTILLNDPELEEDEDD